MMKIVKVNDIGSKMYIVIEAEKEKEKLTIVTDKSKIVEMKGTNLLIKDKCGE